MQKETITILMTTAWFIIPTITLLISGELWVKILSGLMMIIWGFILITTNMEKKMTFMDR